MLMGGLGFGGREVAELWVGLYGFRVGLVFAVVVSVAFESP
jgi:hypothetical protein